MGKITEGVCVCVRGVSSTPKGGPTLRCHLVGCMYCPKVKQSTPEVLKSVPQHTHTNTCTHITHTHNIHTHNIHQHTQHTAHTHTYTHMRLWLEQHTHLSPFSACRTSWSSSPHPSMMELFVTRAGFTLLACSRTDRLCR